MAGSNAVLFESLSSDAAISDSTRLKLRGHLGSGVSSREPMALVVGVAELEKRSSGPNSETKELSENPDPHERRYSTPNILIVILASYRFQYITVYTMKRAK